LVHLSRIAAFVVIPEEARIQLDLLDSPVLSAGTCLVNHEMKQEGSRPACIRYPVAYCGFVNENFIKVMKLMNIGETLKLLFLIKKGGWQRREKETIHPIQKLKGKYYYPLCFLDK